MQITDGYQKFDVTKEKIKILKGKPNQELKFNVLKEHIENVVENKTVLDIGASNGFYTFLAAINGAKKVVALDNENKHVGGKEVSSITEIATKLNFSNIFAVKGDFIQHKDTYDVVFAFSVMHHLYYATNKKFQNMKVLIEKFASVTNDILFIEWVNPLGGGPYQNKTPYKFEDFIKELERYFENVVFIGESTEYNIKNRENRKMFMCSGKIEE